MVLYNLTNMTTGNPLTMAQAANTVSSGWLGILLVIACFVILLIAMKNFPMAVAFSASSFITFIWTLGLYMAEVMTSMYVLIITIIAVAAGVLILILNKDSTI